jgi:hypothetical protein
MNGLAWNRGAILVGIVLCLTVSASFADDSRTFVSPEKAGSSASQRIHVRYEGAWTVDVVFPMRKGIAWDDPLIKRIDALMVDITGGPTTPVKPHKGMRLLVSVVQNLESSDAEIFRKVTSEQQAHTFSEMLVTNFRFKPGNYTVTLTTLDDDPRLSGVMVEVAVTTMPFTR